MTWRLNSHHCSYSLFIFREYFFDEQLKLGRCELFFCVYSNTAIRASYGCFNIVNVKRYTVFAYIGCFSIYLLES